MRHFLLHHIIRIALIMVLMFNLLPVAAAQSGNTQTLTITGTIESVNGTTIVVSGLSVDLTNVTIDLTILQVGIIVEVTGAMTNGVISATTIVVISTPEVTETPVPPVVTPEITPEATATDVAGTGDTIIVIEGPVTNINVNVITIYNFNIWVDPANPLLSDIEIGDLIHINGNASFDNNIIIVSLVNITFVNVVFIENPPPGQQLPDGCKITKKGKVKCSKKPKSSKKS